jgi:DNA polymerase II small subunit
MSYKLLKNQEKNVNWKEFEKFKVFVEKNKGISPLKTVLSFFINESEIENYFKNYIEKFFKKKELKFLELNSFEKQNENTFKTQDEDYKETNEKKVTFFSFLRKDEILVGDYKQMSQNLPEDETLFDEIVNQTTSDENKKKEKSINSINEEDKKFNKKNFEDLLENKNEENKNELNDKKEMKEENTFEVENVESTEKKEQEEIGIMGEKFLKEIKEKVKKLVEVEYSPNKVEWVENDFKIIKSFKANPKKVEVIDFLKYFRSKYKKLRDLLMNRLNGLGKDLITIDNLKDGNTYTIIGMVRELEERNDYMVGVIEDLTGEVRFKANTKEVKEALELVPDDVAAFVGRKKGKTFFIEKIVYPDIPNNSVRWLKDYGVNEDVYALVLSDIHVGSRLFLKEKFRKFIEWLNGKNNKYHGKIGYVIINGDLVDGIGVYPEQIEELEIGSGYDQYKTFASFLELIPSEINVFVAPGNHDIVRLAEPQPILPKDVAEPLLELNNVYLVSNPSMILLKDYIKILNYHGYSYDYFVNEVDHLRGRLSYEKIHELMKLLLRKRHLVPSYKAAPIAPEHEDYLVIDEIPNLMASGHIHYSSVGDYKGIKLLSSSCWQDKTPFQEKVGHNPDPGKIPLVNLRDGTVKILQF